ncbi:MAG: hypothetical protein IKL87_04730 [Oscillospiraceae bacterium]|nr:hypothetical protein [Oscillospiraceae bacterium]
MAATNSTQKLKSPFLTNLHLELRQNLLFAILISILHFTGLPLILHAAKEIAILDQREMPVPEEEYLLSQSLMIFGALSLIITLGLIIVLSVKSFSYVCSKARTDMIYSLPMSHAQRFFSTYLSGVMLWLPAAILSAILSMNLYQQIHFEYDVAYESTLFILIPLIELWIYTMIIFCVNACGKLHAAAITCGVLAFLFPILLFMAHYFVLEMQSGRFYENIYYLMICISGPPIYFVESLFGSTSYIDMLDIGSLFLSAAFNTLLYLGGAYLLHRKRKAEYAGSAFPFRGFYGFIQFVLAGFVSAIYIIVILDSLRKLSDCIPYFLMAILLAMLTLIIFDFIGDHHLRNMKKRISRYVIFTSAATAAVSAFLFTGGFGLPKWIPSADHIQAVSMDYGNIEIPVTDPRIQEALSEAHKKEIALNQTLLTQEVLEAYVVNLDYKPKQLEVIYQSGTNTAIYYITPEDSISQDLLNAIRQSEAYADTYCSTLEQILSSNCYIRNAFSYDHYFPAPSQEDIDRILAAYRKDLTQNHHLNQYNWSPVYGLSANTRKGHLEIEIPYSCIHTVTALEEIFDRSIVIPDEIYMVDAEYCGKYNTVHDILNEAEEHGPSADWKPLTVRQLKELMPYLMCYDYFDTSRTLPFETSRTLLFVLPEYLRTSDAQIFALTREGEKLLETMLS